VLLAEELLKAFRPHPVRQGADSSLPPGGGTPRRGFFEEVETLGQRDSPLGNTANPTQLKIGW
jgi:hypothetical protein